MLRTFSNDNLDSVLLTGIVITTRLRAYILHITQPLKQKLALTMRITIHNSNQFTSS
jgi:hypothetical protein